MRAIIIGDNQFELYRSMQDALISMERPSAESGDYSVFDENGQKYHFVADPEDHSQVGSFWLEKCESSRLSDLWSYYAEWVAYNELKEMPAPGPSLFDDLETKWGLKVSIVD